MKRSNDTEQKIREIKSLLGNVLETVRPSGELDSRAVLVFLFSFAVVAICLAKQDTDEVSVFGFAIIADPRNIGGAISLALIYWWLQLFVAWRLESEQMSIINGEFFGLLEQYNTLKQEQLVKFVALSERADVARRELVAAFEARLEEISECRNQLDLFDWEGRHALGQLEEQEYEKLKQSIANHPEISTSDAQVKAVLDEILSDNRYEFIQLRLTLERSYKVLRIRKIRTVLDFYVPTAFAAVALILFVVFAIKPDFVEFLVN